MIKLQCKPLRTVFSSKVPNEAIDLVAALLEYDPSKRLNALEALAHPFFDELRDNETRLPDGSKLPDIFEFTEEEFQMSHDDLIEKSSPNGGVSKEELLKE